MSPPFRWVTTKGVHPPFGVHPQKGFTRSTRARLRSRHHAPGTTARSRSRRRVKEKRVFLRTFSPSTRPTPRRPRRRAWPSSGSRTRRGAAWRSGSRAREARGGTRSPRRRAKSSGGSPPRCRRRRTKRRLSRRGKNARGVGTRAPPRRASLTTRRFSLTAGRGGATESPLRIDRKSNVAPIPAVDTQSTLFRALSSRKVFAEPPRFSRGSRGRLSRRSRFSRSRRSSCSPSATPAGARRRARSSETRRRRAEEAPRREEGNRARRVDEGIAARANERDDGRRETQSRRRDVKCWDENDDWSDWMMIVAFENARPRKNALTFPRPSQIARRHLVSAPRNIARCSRGPKPA